MKKNKVLRRDKYAHKKYSSPRWLRERKIFLAKYPFCVNYEECHNFSNQVDHITPIQTDKDERFWDQSNWQALCLSCHSRKTARDDGAFGNKKKNEKPLTIIHITCVVRKDDLTVLKNIIHPLIEKYKKINGVNFIEAKSKDDETLYKKMFGVKTLPVIIMSERLAGSKKQSGDNIKRFYDKTIFDDFERELKNICAGAL